MSSKISARRDQNILLRSHQKAVVREMLIGFNVALFYPPPPAPTTPPLTPPLPLSRYTSQGYTYQLKIVDGVYGCMHSTVSLDMNPPGISYYQNSRTDVPRAGFIQIGR